MLDIFMKMFLCNCTQLVIMQLIAVCDCFTLKDSAVFTNVSFLICFLIIAGPEKDGPLE